MTTHDPLSGAPKKSVARKTPALKTTALKAPAKTPAKSKSALAAQGLQAYQLYVELQWVRPKVWRRLLVPVTIGLPALHRALVAGMDWSGGHLHEFVFADERYGENYPNEGLLEGTLDEAGVTLQQALGARKTFIYVYDFGDDWCHKVKVEKIVPLQAPLPLAACLEGENACPPDDVGGPPGYEEFLQALADPAHPEHESMTEWIDYDFDPAEFSVAEVNARLKYVAT